MQSIPARARPVTPRGVGPSECVSSLRCRVRRAMVQRFQPTPLNTSSDRDSGGINRPLDGARLCGIRLVHHNAREPTEHDLDLASLIATAFWTVGIGKPNGNPLDCTDEFAEFHSELSCDRVAVLVLDRCADHTNVGGRRWSALPVPFQLRRPWKGQRQRSSRILACCAGRWTGRHHVVCHDLSEMHLIAPSVGSWLRQRYQGLTRGTRHPCALTSGSAQHEKTTVGSAQETRVGQGLQQLLTGA